MMEDKARILLLAEHPGGAFDISAQSIATHLRDEFEFRIAYNEQGPDLSEWPFNLIQVFFWGEDYHLQLVQDPRRIIKEVASHRWALEEQFGLLTPSQMARTLLQDAGVVIAPSHRLQEMLSAFREVLLARQGCEQETFFDMHKPEGPLGIGWAGNIEDPCKGVKDVLLPAVGRDFDLWIADGSKSHQSICECYNSIDVLYIASTGEGNPLTLLEVMACGCYLVCVDVGIFPELVQHGRNILQTFSGTAFRLRYYVFCIPIW